VITTSEMTRHERTASYTDNRQDKKNISYAVWNFYLTDGNSLSNVDDVGHATDRHHEFDVLTAL